MGVSAKIARVGIAVLIFVVQAHDVRQLLSCQGTGGEIEVKEVQLVNKHSQASQKETRP